MAKRLSTAQWMRRSIESGRESVKSLAAKLGRSPSTVRDVLSGRRPGKNLRESARDLAQGRRAPKLPPPPKRAPKPTPPAPQLSAFQKAELELLRMVRADDTMKVVIYINLPGAGRSITLGAHGGIEVGTIFSHPGGLKEFCEEQAEKQHYSLRRDDENEIDWTDALDSLEFEEYY